jgi:hypothetical protein
VGVAFILGLRGIVSRSKNTIITKLLLPSDTFIRRYEAKEDSSGAARDDGGGKTPAGRAWEGGALRHIRFVVNLLLKEGLFLILRLAAAVVLGVLLGNEPIVLYVFIGGTLYMTLGTEIKLAVQTCRRREVTKSVEKYLGPPS